MQRLLTIIPILLGLITYASERDSLENIINTQRNKEQSIKAYEFLIPIVVMSNPDSAYTLTDEYYQVSELYGSIEGISSSYGWKSYIKKQQGDIPQAITLLARGIEILEKNKDSTLISDLSSAYNNMASLYQEVENYPEAIEYYYNSLEIRKAINDLNGISNTEYNLGVIYAKIDSVEQSIYHYNQALSILTAINFPPGIAYTKMGMGAVYLKTGKLDSAMNTLEESLSILQMIGDIRGEAHCLYSISNIHLNQKEYNKAIQFAQQAYKYAIQIKSASIQRDASMILYKAYESKKQYPEAFMYYTEYVKMRDSLVNLDNQKAAYQSQLKYEFDKEHYADSLQYAQEEKQKEMDHQLQMDKQQRQNRYLYVGILIIAVIGIIVFLAYRRKRKDNEIIKEQKLIVEEQKNKVVEAHEELEEKNQEIMDSIRYAKRIQSAILPPDKIFKEFLPNSFVLYLPKDIVAGDFYWLEKKNDHVCFAAADCTGHGVPGAMVSVICNNGLNRSIREHHLTDPGKILDKTREIVIQEFEKSEEEVKDGMDIALVSLELRASAESENETPHSHSASHSVLKYAGANNPLWIIRKGTSEIEEIKANKQPIGNYADPKPYTTNEITINSGDTIYLFSDGFPDQFGGEKGKKYKYSKFKDFLVSIVNEPMENQQELIKLEFENWKGKFEQIDDVCIIGVQIS
ncbi:MAG: tetratricopeptide repeat protein [Crocinitomicaceae bacterium]|nr:tetratricopeptide repeat protein [Crocinitomicaceae bacterium]